MTFFNKKEEILEIKLTSYGKHRLSAGKFKPVYYAFFDDDVLYDGARGGITEDNNNIEPRIQENTPSLRTQTNFNDLEAEVRKQRASGDRTQFTKDDTVFDDDDGLRNVLPLGNSELGNVYTAAWGIQFLKGDFWKSRSSTYDPTDTSACYTAAPYRCQKPTINIPQLEAKVEVAPKIVEKDFVGVVDEETGKYITELDGKFLRLEDDFILLEIQEKNVELLNDSFSIEVYEITTDHAGKEVLKPKMFKKEIELIRDGILLDEAEISAQVSTESVDNNYVEYFFEIKMDNSIDEKTKYDHIVMRDGKSNLFDTVATAQQYAQDEGDTLYTTDNEGDEC